MLAGEAALAFCKSDTLLKTLLPSPHALQCGLDGVNLKYSNSVLMTAKLARHSTTLPGALLCSHPADSLHLQQNVSCGNSDTRLFSLSGLCVTSSLTSGDDDGGDDEGSS